MLLQRRAQLSLRCRLTLHHQLAPAVHPAFRRMERRPGISSAGLRLLQTRPSDPDWFACAARRTQALWPLYRLRSLQRSLQRPLLASVSVASAPDLHRTPRPQNPQNPQQQPTPRLPLPLPAHGAGTSWACPSELALGMSLQRPPPGGCCRLSGAAFPPPPLPARAVTMTPRVMLAPPGLSPRWRSPWLCMPLPPCLCAWEALGLCQLSAEPR